ncbi:ABC-type glycerol-3-phosphate transport system, substrate-binding protein [Treponema bryantii]|uniref:ABC-type glycerol-3-phosphate transport system, substrate-binding protein n=1 Tax=Treponema bryantii TaxID=163 RepID=A0A1I3JQ91_9SPIR|nr:ABC transporter substrate-binding protein [Treponema bryantii]SFI62334.1 ABC-type glycerol-3-phosphate transport system, substrate-binding protein [Treponema bryantii]
MKKILSVLCVLTVAAALFTGCSKKGSAKGPVTINLWSFTDEIPGMVDKYIASHPDCGFTVNTTIIATTEGAYQPALDQALMSGGADAPDIYAAEAAFILKYSQGDMQQYAMPYKDLGIDIDAKIKAAEIAPYTVDIGSNTSGQVDALGYQTTGGCFIYRRSIAKKVFGTDDPKTINDIIGGGSGNWTAFNAAAAKLGAAGVAIVSGDGDIWHAYENSSDKGWIVDGKLYIDPKREAFIDASKALTDNGWSNQTQDWTDAWFADMKDTGAKPCFGFFGPAWLINYTLAPNCGGEKVGEGTYGDWAVCNSPIGFFWGGTWILANKSVPAAKKDAVRTIIEWITLDSTNDGLLYKWANGTLNGEGGTKDTVSSGVVMAKSNGELAFLGGQNMFDYFVPANKYANGKNLTQYDETINSLWREQVRAYANGQKSRDAAIKDFKQNVADKLGVE